MELTSSRKEERAPTLGKLVVGWAIGSVAGNPLSVLDRHAFRLAHVVLRRSALSSLPSSRCSCGRAIPLGVRRAAAAKPRALVSRVHGSSAALADALATALTRNVGGTVMLSFIGKAHRRSGARHYGFGARGVVFHRRHRRADRQFVERAYGAAAPILRSPTNALSSPASCCSSGPCSRSGSFASTSCSSSGAGAAPDFQPSSRARLIVVAAGTRGCNDRALNSSVTYLGAGAIGASIGSTAWTLISPRCMP